MERSMAIVEQEEEEVDDATTVRNANVSVTVAGVAAVSVVVAAAKGTPGLALLNTNSFPINATKVIRNEIIPKRP